MLLAGLLAGSCGCMTPRMAARVDKFPHNRVFRAAEAPPRGDAPYVFAEYDRGQGQSLCVLRLAPDAKLAKRFHSRSDLTLSVVSGSAIVIVEKTRYFVGPGDAVLLPRYTAYSVLPHESEGDFVALMVYSPPFGEMDVSLEH